MIESIVAVLAALAPLVAKLVGMLKSPVSPAELRAALQTAHDATGAALAAHDAMHAGLTAETRAAFGIAQPSGNDIMDALKRSLAGGAHIEGAMAAPNPTVIAVEPGK